MAQVRARLIAALQHKRKANNMTAEAFLCESDDEQTLSKGRRQAVVAAATMLPAMEVDSRDSEEVQEDMRRGTMYRQHLKKLKPLLPKIGRGNSEANDSASRQRRPLVFPNDQGGIYETCDSQDLRYKTGFEKDEFDSFYADTFKGVDGEQLPRSWLFRQARNNLGKHSAEENESRRTIRGSMNDRDRVLCWLEMLRRDVIFEDMAQKYGRCKGTWQNEFRDMTTAAQNMPCLQTVSIQLFVVCSMYDTSMLFTAVATQHDRQQGSQT